MTTSKYPSHPPSSQSPALAICQVVEEQRYRSVPQSELDRLDKIEPDVDEAWGLEPSNGILKLHTGSKGIMAKKLLFGV